MPLLQSKVKGDPDKWAGDETKRTIGAAIRRRLRVRAVREVELEFLGDWAKVRVLVNGKAMAVRALVIRRGTASPEERIHATDLLLTVEIELLSGETFSLNTWEDSNHLPFLRPADDFLVYKPQLYTTNFRPEEHLEEGTDSDWQPVRLYNFDEE